MFLTSTVSQFTRKTVTVTPFQQSWCVSKADAPLPPHPKTAGSHGDFDDIDLETIKNDTINLLTLKAMIDHCAILLDDIDLEVDPTIIEAGDLDLMPELLGDLKSTLGTIVQIAARMFLSPQN